VKVYVCDICHRRIEKEAHGGEHPSAGDHDSGEHVLAAYGGGTALFANFDPTLPGRPLTADDIDAAGR